VKTFVCGDVHGNFRALQAALEVYRAAGAPNFIFLGDCVGYGAHPDACLDVILNLPRSRLVLGNHDAALLDAREREGLNVIASKAIDWAERRLPRRYLDAIRSRFAIQREEGGVLAVHASPSHPEEWPYIFSEIDADEAFRVRDFDLCFVGHTHSPVVYGFDGGERRLVAGAPFVLEPGKRYIVNPGSVGQPRDGDPRAACCVFDDEAGTVTLHRCAYDIEAEARDIVEAGLPEFLGRRLFDGA
jgi:diadenosine tetraphosphatase ApaH/serine/threonine PP2A family protein phosphatase